MVIKLNLINSNFSHHRLDNSVYFFRNDYGSHLSEKSFHKPSKGWNFVHNWEKYIFIETNRWKYHTVNSLNYKRNWSIDA